MRPQVEKLYDEKKKGIKEIADQRVHNLEEFEQKLLDDQKKLPDEIKKLKQEVAELDSQLEEARAKIEKGEKIDISNLEKMYAEKSSELEANIKYLEHGIPDLMEKYKAAFAKSQAVVDQGVLGLKKGFSEYSYINVEKDPYIVGDENSEGLLKNPLGQELNKQVGMDEKTIAKKEAFDKLEEELDGLDPEKDKDKIAQIKDKMKALDPKAYEKVEEYDKLQEELKGLDPEKDKDKIDQIQAKMKKLGRDSRVKSLQALKANTERNKDLLKYAPEAPNKENIENTEKVEPGDKVEQKEQANAAPKQNVNITPEMAAQIARAMAAQGQPVQENDGQVAGDDLENAEPKDFLAMLGYEKGTEINHTNSKDILEKFMNNPEISNRVRMEMINDPNCKDVLLNCLRTAGKNKKLGKDFKDTRRKILDFAKGSLVNETLKDIGLDEKYFNMSKKEFDHLELTYREEIKKLELKLDKANLMPEQVIAIQDTINEYESVRSKLKNAIEFQKCSDHIKTFGTRIQDAKDFVFKKFGIDKKALNPATAEKISADNTAEPERVSERPSWEREDLVKTDKEKAADVIKREKVDEKANKNKDEIKKEDKEI